MKRILLFSFIFFQFLGLKAQIFTTKNVVSYNINGPQVVKSADFNNDGYNDLIYTTITDHKIVANLFNPSKGDFDSAYVITSSFNYAVSLFTADLDGDGNTDFLTVSQQYNKVAWFKNDGTGNFTLQTLINDNAQGASAVIAVDIDNDGDEDVVSCEKTDNKILWYENDGNGNFSSPNEITADAEIPVTLASADLNNDGFQDIICGYGQTDKIVYFLNNQDGTFATAIQVTDQADYINSIKAGDVDNDGFTDIVSVSKNDNKLAWYRNLEGNGFSSQIVIADTIMQAFDLDLADFDLDNDLDIVCTSQSAGKIYFYKNEDGIGGFDIFHIDSAYDSGAKGVVASDFNNDGLIDIAAALSTEDPDEVAWYQNGRAFFKVNSINKNHDINAIDTYDIDGDGDQDIFYASSTGIYAVPNNNAGHDFGGEVSFYEDGYNITALKFIDIDNDGDKDLFCLDGMGDKSFWFRNQGYGDLGTPITIDDQGDGPITLAYADYDNDGDTDLLVALVNGYELAIYNNTDGNGTFQKRIISDTVRPYSAEFMDVDNDGYLDIIFSTYYYTAAYLNDGSGNFNTFLSINDTLGYAEKLIVEDLNNDNYKDIIYYPDQGMTWLENNHDATFTPHFLPDMWGYSDVAINDVDNDGDWDIFNVGWHLGYMYMGENINYTDTILEDLPPVYVEGAKVITVADINNDGWNDFVIGSWPNENICWVENYQYRLISNPVDYFACEGGKAYFSVLTTGVQHFQWQVNTGSGFTDIVDNQTYSGANKAQLVIDSVTSDMYGYQFRCLIYDKNNQETITDTASLNLYTPYLQCVGNQEVIIDSGDTYTVEGDEFDARAFNKCHENLTLINDYNNTETLAGATFSAGTHTVTWYLKDDQNQTIDSCSFDVSVSTPEAIKSVADFGVNVYPNPTTGIFTINLKESARPLRVLESVSNLQITDITGKTIKQLSIDSYQLSIDLTNQPAGIYFVKIQTESNIIIKKIIKE